MQLPDALIRRAHALMGNRPRTLLGIAGAPGAGKSTVAQLLAQALGEQAVIVPMDGFHLANRELARLGRSERKGAPDTFDAEGYRALLQRLAEVRPGEVVYAPYFDRELEEGIAGGIAVAPQVRLVISEGNYLLLPEGPWAPVANLFAECWYVDVPAEQRRLRLVQRHMRYGRSREQAERWVQQTDEPNARTIEAHRGRAALQVPWRDQ
ncbi:nucleoside/nucleotide kinase family protein [Pseudomonas typographi]|uniref:Nucleoside/nucleotide kinase family protein n=1 Tax=Pseudomonas typographi TaxID=2715964 RepID=A0ABR7Z1I0_9PSED|nr:nucleoside/nucleotide kinase family protein [Pseudomonas typographi]MBD1551757.1 nucleoside/nucleotide kinase family protein [Pseudomonas typographi]MBD1586988.1 nucleoside/nucleotide kinase family protein [Pseudomonas typographi]MBD1599228.1 nucleoside/nucleotide kinase family protein [Pseudomonas typographi]